MLETRTRVKICGINKAEDARAAVEMGADALGFICVRESPRYVSPSAIGEIAQVVPPFVALVAVVRNREDHPAATHPSVDAIQYYSSDSGSRPAPGAPDLGRRRAIRA